MSIDYIRKTYSVDFKVGQQVRIKPGCASRFQGRVGKLISARGAYLKVTGEGGWGGQFHPLDVEHVKEPSP
jgi:ribosomal protein L21E